MCVSRIESDKSVSVSKVVVPPATAANERFPDRFPTDAPPLEGMASPLAYSGSKEGSLFDVAAPDELKVIFIEYVHRHLARYGCDVKRDRRYVCAACATPITDLAVKRGDLVVATHGRSFWILDDLSVLHQLRPDLGASEPHLFEPRAAVRWVDGSGGGGRGAVGQNPPFGAVIHYLLPEGLDAEDADEVKLEILDADGRLDAGETAQMTVTCFSTGIGTY